MRLWLAGVILLVFTGLASAAGLTTSAKLRIEETNHYRIHTDLDRELSADLGRRMDAMYEEYSRRLACFDTNHSGNKFNVYLFAKRNNYLEFTGYRLSNAAGVTMPDINVVAAYLQNQGRDGLRQTLQHEAFHQFAASVINHDLPPWLNEGLAVVFEEGIWTGRNFLLGQIPPRRIRQLQNDIASNKLIDFHTMLTMSHKDWNTVLNSDRMRGATEYTQAWAMCEFLIYAGEHEGSPRGHAKYRARFLDMLQRIHAGTDAMAAFTQAFSPNYDGFQTLFTRWAAGLVPSPEATLIERQNILADMLSKFSQEGRRFDAMDAFRQTLIRGGYQMQYTVNNVKWETDANPRIYFRDLDGRPYNSDEQYFDVRDGAPLPDLVCDAVAQIHLRTRFYDLPGNGIEHETLVEGGGNGR